MKHQSKAKTMFSFFSHKEPVHLKLEQYIALKEFYQTPRADYKIIIEPSKSVLFKNLFKN